MKSLIKMIAVAAFLSSGAAMAAETKTAADAANTAKVTTAKPVKAETTKMTADKVARSEKSKKCSADADAQHLHGKPRKEFRKTCMKAA